MMCEQEVLVGDNLGNSYVITLNNYDKWIDWLYSPEEAPIPEWAFKLEPAHEM